MISVIAKAHHMKINKTNGLVDGIQFIPSPNQDNRPTNADICLLVIHNISLPPGEFGGKAIHQFFSNQLTPTDHPFFEEIKDLRVSAHLLIQRNGNMTQYVPFHKRAWHAGVSTFKNRTHCNDFSIGIEMEGTDFTPYEEIQYEKLAQVSSQLMNTYPAITHDNITGHCHIAPERKTDPGKHFDWDKYHALIGK